MRLRGLTPRGLFAACGIFLVSAAIGTGTVARTASARSLVGLWLTEGGDGVIAVRPCGGGYCGRIVGMSQLVGDDGKPPSDPTGRPNCGRDILHAERRADPGVNPGVWAGDIVNPDDNSDWRCEIWLSDGRLHLRGYVLTPLFGKTQTWTPYEGHVASDCRMG